MCYDDDMHVQAQTLIFWLHYQLSVFCSHCGVLCCAVLCCAYLLCAVLPYVQPEPMMLSI